MDDSNISTGEYEEGLGDPPPPEPKPTTKVHLGPKRLLELVRLGIINGNYQAVIDLIDDALEQLPEDS